jgi:hypothetical protein
MDLPFVGSNYKLMGKPRRQHYIPISYLNQFATNDELVVFDFINERKFTTSPHNTAHIKDFYSVDAKDPANENIVESYFSEKTENSAKSIIDEYIKTMRLPNKNNWIHLVEFIASMYVRGPRFRFEYLEIAEGFLKMRAHHVLANPTSYEYQQLAKHGEPEELLKDVSKIQITPHQNQYILAMLKSIPELTEVISRMTPTLLYSCGSSGFITSDDQIILSDPTPDRFHGSGWVKDSIEVYFPLSPFTCLLLRWNSEENVSFFNDRQVAMINSLLISSATQYLFAKGEVAWISNSHKIIKNDALLFQEFAESKKKRNFLKCSNIQTIPKEVTLNRIKKSRYDKLQSQKATNHKLNNL